MTNDNELIGYAIEADEFRKLRAIADRLQGGSDRERDEGHRLWLIVDRAEPIYNLKEKL